MEELFTKTTLKNEFRLKPALEAKPLKSYKNQYGNYCDLYRKEDCIPMRKKSSKPQSEKQIRNAKRLSLMGKMKSDEYIASIWSREMLNKELLFLDTETIGLNRRDQIVQISILNKKGDILFDSLVNPNAPIPEEATNIHGISDNMVKDSPLWKDIEHNIKTILEGKQIAIFNRNFDITMLNQTSLLNGISTDWINSLPYEECVMEVASKYINGKTDKWISLSNACIFMGVDLTNAHTALADTEATRLLLIKMAEYSTSLDNELLELKNDLTK